ncbi:hypothetical protein BMF94_2691 [Rhodotorula taiwanensis]|uniref:MYND-type domain-containing protein n=1 Tax=Rhodotorula taiwanensis TaxID=741276 RepID=A0A2S5BBX9_9BASI|nr:hypothetical protein BMF94_2691 [Rhodotorula taiwanensis]
MPATAPKGSCLVCGTETTKRCSGCGPYTHLYFCSTEHQRLAWPCHRWACGSAAHPFRLPAFSEKELDETMEMLNCKSDNPQVVGLVHAANVKLLGKRTGATDDEKKRVLRALLGHRVVFGTADDKQQSMNQRLSDLRVIRHVWLTTAVSGSDADDPIGFFSLRYHDCTSRVPTRIKDGQWHGASEWHSTFCHLLLVLAPIFARFPTRVKLDAFMSDPNKLVGMMQSFYDLRVAVTHIKEHLRAAVTSQERAFADAVLAAIDDPVNSCFPDLSPLSSERRLSQS